ncbi:MAG: hypothetical protein KAR06_04090 [Deltaproteobacteria bacterium]|nr:hypothetical protein [Deltaproteobacteria bacterium]
MKNRIIKIFALLVFAGLFTASCDREDQGSEQYKDIELKVEVKPGGDFKGLKIKWAYFKPDVKIESTAPAVERAKGIALEGPKGVPFYTWGDVSSLPTIDEVFTEVKDVSEVVKIKENKKNKTDVKTVKLPETEERKKLKDDLWSDDAETRLTEEGDGNYLYAIQSPNRGCVLELYNKMKSTEDSFTNETWVSGIDPETYEVLWKYEEPGFYEHGNVVFAMDANVFLLTNLEYWEKDSDGLRHKLYKVKLFDCASGFVKEVFVMDTVISNEIPLHPPSPMAKISSDGSLIMAASATELVVYDSLKGKVLSRVGTEDDMTMRRFHMSGDLKYAFAYWRNPYQNFNGKCCNKFQLIDLESGKVLWSKIIFSDLGDRSANPLYRKSNLTVGADVTVLWFSGPGIQPSDSIVMLINRKGEHLMFLNRGPSEILEDGESNKYFFDSGKLYDLKWFVEERER